MSGSRGQFQVDFLRAVMKNGGTIAGARFSLQRGLLKSVDPLYSLTLDQHGVRSLQELPWTPELEKLLLFETGRQMDTLDDETERFAAILLNNLQTAEAHYGKDFARSVLVATLRERPEYELRALLDRTAAATPSRSSKHYGDCATFLRSSIDGLRNSAIENLGYGTEVAMTAMTNALAIVLDETFHISAADLLFPKHG